MEVTPSFIKKLQIEAQVQGRIKGTNYFQELELLAAKNGFDTWAQIIARKSRLHRVDYIYAENSLLINEILAERSLVESVAIVSRRTGYKNWRGSSSRWFVISVY